MYSIGTTGGLLLSLLLLLLPHQARRVADVSGNNFHPYHGLPWLTQRTGLRYAPAQPDHPYKVIRDETTQTRDLAVLSYRLTVHVGDRHYMGRMRAEQVPCHTYRA